MSSNPIPITPSTTTRVFFDTEFIDTPDCFKLISLGLVSETNDKFYALLELPEVAFWKVWNNEWLCTNVMWPIYKDLLLKDHNHQVEIVKRYTAGVEVVKEGQSNVYILSKDGSIAFGTNYTLSNAKVLYDTYCITKTMAVQLLTEYFKRFKEVQLYGYYCSYDFVLLCRLFGKMLLLPENVKQFPIDLTVMERHFKGLTGGVKFPEGSVHNALGDAILTKQFFEEICVKVGKVF